jgi:hypothetical protein
MAPTKETALNAIFDAMHELNDTLDEGRQIHVAQDTVLMGGDSVLSSLDLVTLVSAAEQNLCDAWGVDIILASEDAMSRRHSPYRTPETLAEYALEVVRRSDS